ncbi:MAG TPA: diacylglycerol kinase family protein [Patescibacteria group bacterium]|nr:diacylglycerol kinase family protein [Patescibacteria group bacterium]
MAEGFATRWQKRRSERRAHKKIAMFGNAKQAGLGMGREQLKAGVEGTLRKHFPTKPVRGGSAYVEINLTHNLDQLAEAKERTMREDPPEIVVLFGGDGTTQKTLGEDPDFLRYLTADPEYAPEIVVIGGGTKNVVPTALKLLGDDPIQALDAICQKIERGIPREVRPCPILKINDRHGFIYGSGLVVNALDEYYRHEAGRWRATKAGVSIVWRETLGRLSPWRRPSIFRRFGAEISSRGADGAEERVGLPSYNGVIASSLREIHSLLKVTHRAGKRLSCFHAICHNNGFWRSALNLPGFINQDFPLLGSVSEFVTDRMVIRYDQPMRHTIDGEVYDSTEKLGRAGLSESGEEVVVIETGPYIKFIVA